MLEGVSEQPIPEVLWNMRYQQRVPNATRRNAAKHGIISLPSLSQSLAFDDSVIDEVKSAWHKVTGEPEEHFMKFDARDGFEDDDTTA